VAVLKGSNKKMNCQICNRPLNNPNDPLSLDCGGDCWGCIGEIEAEAGYKPSIDIVEKEYKLGIRRKDIPKKDE
jgi:hypothetical protein